MSGFISEPERDIEIQRASNHYGKRAQTQGQRHDRMERDVRDVTPAVAVVDGDERDGQVEVDISAGQKMLSAVSGSLLTSLLGKQAHLTSPTEFFIIFSLIKFFITVTPLDVVRVRQQSRPSAPTPLARSISTLPPGSSFSNLPPNLGVTACCREVFWVNNNAQFCVATPISHSSSTASTLASECAVDTAKTLNARESIMSSLRSIARNDGFTSLWRGLSPTLLMSIPGNVIYFTGYDSLRDNPYSPIKQYCNDKYAPLVAGSIARIAAATVVSPIEMFRTRLQATTGPPGTGHFAATLRGLGDLVRSQGYTSLWRGLQLTMWRDVPFSGIYWWTYEASREKLADMREQRRGRDTTDILGQHTSRARSSSRSKQNHSVTFIDSFLSGALSGSIASAVTTPFDVGKTRQQVLKQASDFAPVDGAISRAASPALLSESPRPENLSMPRFLYHIYETEGIPGLFRGGLARCLKVAPACAIMISSYEVGKKMARGANEQASEVGN